MADVKPTLRQRQTEVTKGLILEAARSLFRAQGYVATSIEQIAAEAGTGVSTIYAVFGNKRELLVQLRWRAVQAAGLPDIESSIPAGAPARETLALLAARFRRVYESAADILTVHRAALDSDRELVANWEQARRDRRAHMERLLQPLLSELRPGLNPRQATDLLEALLGFDLYQELVSRDGWLPDEYEEWLSRTLVEQLLGSARVG